MTYKWFFYLLALHGIISFVHNGMTLSDMDQKIFIISEKWRQKLGDRTSLHGKTTLHIFGMNGYALNGAKSPLFAHHIIKGFSSKHLLSSLSQYSSLIVTSLLILFKFSIPSKLYHALLWNLYDLL